MGKCAIICNMIQYIICLQKIYNPRIFLINMCVYIHTHSITYRCRQETLCFLVFATMTNMCTIAFSGLRTFFPSVTSWFHSLMQRLWCKQEMLLQMGIRLSPLTSGLADLKICALVSTSIGEDKRSVQMRPMI